MVTVSSLLPPANVAPFLQPSQGPDSLVHLSVYPSIYPCKLLTFTKGHVLGTVVLGTVDATENRTDPVPVLIKPTF